MSLSFRVVAAISLSLAAMTWPGRLIAQIGAPPEGSQEEPQEPATPAPPPGPNDALVLEQQRISDQFKHLEEVLLRMAEVSASSDPRRAALLRQAVAQSKQRLIGLQFENLVTLLNQDQLSRAIEGQKKVNQDLRSLLELLLSEDRGRRLESEKARIREYLKRLENILKQQKSLQGRTASSSDPQPLAKPQAELAQQTGGLAETIKSNEENGKSAGQKSDKSPPAEPPSAGPRPTPRQPDGRPADHQTPSEGKSNPQGQPPKQQGSQSKSSGQPSQDQPSQPNAQKSENSNSSKSGKSPKSTRSPSANPAPGQQGPSQDKQMDDDDQPSPQNDQQEHPARQRLQAAQDRMREAQQKLQQAQRDGATQKQEEAIRELEQAKAKLEEILRQLREEEIGRTLAQLETRFRKMLQMQRDVYEGTVRLGKVPQAERNHSHDIEAGRFSTKESEIVLEADKALSLMREDGTAVAFPEAAGQMREDMQQVVQRLAQSKVDRMTQAIEEDILAALEEMIASLQKAQKDMENKKQQGQPSQGESQDPPLIDMLSELKMIRALQVRVNSRTERYSKLVEGEQATTADVLDALKRLAERQERIYRVTHDLQRERNQ